MERHVSFFSKYLLSAYYMPATVLGTVVTLENKNKIPVGGSKEL